MESWLEERAIKGHGLEIRAIGERDYGELARRTSY